VEDARTSAVRLSLFARDCGAACDGIAEGINRRSFDSASAVAKDATKSKGADAPLRMTIQEAASTRT